MRLLQAKGVTPRGLELANEIRNNLRGSSALKTTWFLYQIPDCASPMLAVHPVEEDKLRIDVHWDEWPEPYKQSPILFATTFKASNLDRQASRVVLQLYHDRHVRRIGIALYRLCSPLVGSDAFTDWVETTEKTLGHTVYTEMSEDQMLQWIKAVHGWIKAHPAEVMHAIMCRE